MSNVEDLTIQLHYADNSDRQFYMPGDIMKGLVTLYLRGPIRAKVLEVFVYGTGTVSWEISGKKTLCSDAETYVEGSHKILEEENGRSISLGRGTHTYSFEYELPSDIPSSFNGVYGNVTYLTKIVLECEDERHNLMVSEPFLFLRRPHLPDDTFTKREMSQNRFYVGFCEGGKVKVNCSLTKTGGVPGEDISVYADVMNWSPRQISLIHASVILNSVYYANGKTIAFRQIINKRLDPYDFDNRKGRRWRNVLLAIPPYIAETGLNFCNLIDVSYSFQFRVSISGKKDILLECPLLVGGHPQGYEVGYSGTGLQPSNVETSEIKPWHGGQSVFTESLDGDHFLAQRL